MSKKLLPKLLIGLVFLAVAVIWLLSALEIAPFNTMNWSWILAVAAFSLALIFILAGVFSKSVGMVKKLYVFLGAGLVVAGIFALVGTFIDANHVLPIIAVVLISAILLSVLVVGGKKWDEGDNHSVGYKNYYQRKAEEEKKEKENKNKNDD